ncbi:MAG: GNAT family N-acetyltransferase [Bacilli bacterium]|nr:GNAT family N-acetyltransferase [Bacilli bacterium]
MSINAKEYIENPCKSSSLPYWKSKSIVIPSNLIILREDEYKGDIDGYIDKPYFKLIHHLKYVDKPAIIDGYTLINITPEELVNHIKDCYQDIGITIEEAYSYQNREVYDKDLWLGLKDNKTNKVIASGIGEIDKTIKEGTLEWIQVSPDYRGLGFGKLIVEELLSRMLNKADFVTVSGKVNNPTNPLKLYELCGFENKVIWHILHKK